MALYEEALKNAELNVSLCKGGSVNDALFLSIYYISYHQFVTRSTFVNVCSIDRVMVWHSSISMRQASQKVSTIIIIWLCPYS